MCVCYIQFAGDTSVYICCTVMSKQTLYYYLLQVMIPLLLCRQQGEEATKRHTACGTAGETYVSLEVWMLWLGFLTSITIVHDASTAHGAYV